MAKKEKKIKMVKAKKLPGILKKRYTQKKLESKLINKLYIPADKEFISNLFKPDPKKDGFLRADLSVQISKSDLKRYKTLAKEIKKNKFGFKVMPFAAVLIFISALCLGIILFKNVAVKIAIQSAMQTAFNAKTDIGSVNLKLLDAKLEVKNLAQASSDDEMKNLFQVADLTLDFNLTEALRGKVDIENITIGEVLLNTDRTKSGKLKKSAKVKKEKQKKEKTVKAEKSNSSKQNDLINKTQNTLNTMFADYNPENIIQNMESNLKSIELAQNIQKSTEEIIEKWKDEPEKIQDSVNQMQKLTKDIQNFDYNKLNDPVKIKEMIELVNSAIKSGNEIANQTKSIVKNVEKDSATVKKYSSELQNAIASDKKLVDSEIGKFSTLKDKGIKNVFNDMIAGFVYGMADQYSPKARVYINKGLELKAKHDASAAKKNSDKQKAKKLKMKKRIAQRAPGRFVYYKQDRVPKFLLEKASGSGAEWNLLAKEFSSDADKRNTESLLNAGFTISGIKNDIHAVIDARTQTENPVVNANYKGKNIPTDVVIESYGMKSKSALDCTAIVSKTQDGVYGSGVLDLSEIQIITPSFEPQIIYDIYKETLDSIKTMSVSFDYKWSEEDGLELELNTNAGEIFQNAFTSSFNKAITKISNQARERVNTLLSEKTGIATDKISEFTDIEKVLKSSDKQVQNMKGELENKKKELQNLANGAADKAKAELEAKAKAEAERLKKEAEEAAKKEAEKQVKNLIKGFGF